ncbi:hypothetical protein ABRZ24_08000 [Brenneria populi]|uniref:Uncharacterized protein n=1 Tax=Brenneria populi TaxID=1505588 RepID=A0ABU6JQ21_9GAMM|nr:hypothetical protein [Brenneria populi Li et al. 2015]
MTMEIEEKNAELITTAKKLLPLVFKSSLSVTVCAIFVIWFYLATLGRLDVFIDAIGFSTLLGIVFGFTIVAFAAICALIFISSLILVLIVTEYENTISIYSYLKHSLIRICLLNGCLFGPIVIGFFYLYDLTGKHGVYFFLAGSALIILSSYLATYFIFHRSKYNRCNGSNLNSAPLLNILMPLSLIIPALTQIIPLSLLLSKISFQAQDGDLEQGISIAIISLIFATISFSPGMLFISGFKKGNLLRSTILAFMIVPFCIMLLASFIPILPLMITNMAMNLAGIADWRTHHYTIKNEVYPHSMFPGQQWNTRYYADIPNRFFITGIAMFSFGDIKLICPTSIRQAQLENMTFNFKNREENQKKSEALKSAAMPCFPIDKKDITQWDIPLSAPIYYEKVRLTTPRAPGDIFQYLRR